jgi:hypothetical protein
MSRCISCARIPYRRQCNGKHKSERFCSRVRGLTVLLLENRCTVFGITSDPRWCQLNPVAWNKVPLHDLRAQYPVEAVGTVLAVIDAHGIKENVASSRASERVGFDQGCAAAAVLINVIEIDAESIGRRKTNHLNKRCT